MNTLLLWSLIDINEELELKSQPRALSPHQNLSKIKQDFEPKKSTLFQSKNILVVDDDEINILVATSYIKKLGFDQVSIARNGQEAIDHIKNAALKREFFDIVFMDCNMPVMDGFQATKVIKEMVERDLIKRLQIIAVTANVADSDREKCLRNGMDHFLTKPIKPNDLKVKTISFFDVDLYFIIEI